MAHRCHRGVGGPLFCLRIIGPRRGYACCMPERSAGMERGATAIFPNPARKCRADMPPPSVRTRHASAGPTSMVNRPALISHGREPVVIDVVYTGRAPAGGDWDARGATSGQPQSPALRAPIGNQRGLHPRARCASPVANHESPAPRALLRQRRRVSSRRPARRRSLLRPDVPPPRRARPARSPTRPRVGAPHRRASGTRR
jgi:hypothetical protein